MAGGNQRHKVVANRELRSDDCCSARSAFAGSGWPSHMAQWHKDSSRSAILCHPVPLLLVRFYPPLHSRQPQGSHRMRVTAQPRKSSHPSHFHSKIKPLLEPPSGSLATRFQRVRSIVDLGVTF